MIEIEDAEFSCPRCGKRETYLSDDTPWCDDCTRFDEWPLSGGVIVKMEKLGDNNE